MISTNSDQFEALDVVKNLDFLLRSNDLQTILMAADFPKEPLLETALSLADSLIKVYQRKILVLDFNESQSSSMGFYQNIRTLSEVKEEEIINQSKLEIYMNECCKHYDQIMVLPHIKLNIEESSMPSVKLDGAILLRSKKSIAPSAKKILTNKIQDSQIAIKAILDTGV